MPDLETVLTETHARTRLVRVNRPSRANALDPATDEALRRALVAADEDPRVEAIALTGIGRHFCAGADLDSVVATQDGSRDWSSGGGLTGIDGGRWTPRKLSIALVNGAAVGAGAELALACDFLIMSSTGYLAFPEATAGVVGGAVVGQRLVRQLPFRIALEIVVTGRRLTSDEALRWGLANAVTEPDDLLEVGLGLAAKLTKPESAEAIRATARALGHDAESTIGDALGRCYPDVEAYVQSPRMQAAVARLASRD
ncbi:enoyl-CoA hydratase/isomerase family protein [Nocardia sp. CA-120079]|uniref:enoyl-CoA hydratase/isomerase family protein n=1 Tax=Nocardia sp. CA-120079 TaxID=3239974 RepID=UPI003D97B923